MIIGGYGARTGLTVDSSSQAKVGEKSLSVEERSDRSAMASSPNLTLEVLNGVTVQVVVSDEPWALDLDTLVVAVGPEGFGGLGQTMRQRVPEAFAAAIPFQDVTPSRPYWYHLGGHSPLTLTSIILATAHDPGGRDTVTFSSPPTIEAAATGLVRSLELAEDQGVPRVGATLLGTGMIGFDPDEVAAVTVPQIRQLVFHGRFQRLLRIVLIAEDEHTRNAIGNAWQPLASSEGRIRAELVDVVERWLPGTSLSSTASAVVAGALRGQVPDRRLAFPETDDRLVGEEILLETLRRQAERRRPDVATALLHELISMQAATEPAELFWKIGNALHHAPSKGVSSQPHEVADAIPLLTEAAALAERTIGQRHVRQRHLLAAAVLERPLIDSVRDSLGVDDAGLRRCLRAAITQVLPNEAPSAWDEILLDRSPRQGKVAAPAGEAQADSGEPAQEQYSTTDLAGGYSTDLVDPEEAIPASADLLGINAYVSMLANVVASADTPLPLSIGLFGEWGSGKSFFMGRLRQQIAELGTQEGYLSRVEQIGFNAWHYADTNLWASLGDEIFRQLARPRTEELRENEDKRRSQLVEDLGKTLNRERELEAATGEAQRRTTELRTQLDAARVKQGQAATVLLRSFAGSDTMKKELRRAWRRLGIHDEVEQGELLAQQIRGLTQDVGTFRRATAGWRGIGLATVIAVSIMVLAAGALAPGALRDGLVRGGLAGIGGGLATLAALVGRVSAGARLVTKVATELREAKDGAVSTKVREQVAALTQAEATADILTTQLQAVRDRAADIGRQLAELAPGQRFYGFVADRAASQDYQSQLGLISTIRRDFEKLIDLMQDWRDNPNEHGNHQPIDRIVLYIDDLDRCSPDQVVEVLQAVHLLLALDLFVVVVGVDPRWLLHSLEQHYRENFVSDSRTSRQRQKKTESQAWDATPLNYLEKIFNIPFVLPGMTSASFTELISGWSAGTAVAPARAPVAALPAEPSVDTTAVDEARQTATTPMASREVKLSGVEPETFSGPGVATDVPVEAGSAVDRIGRGDRPKPRPLSAEEVTHLRALAPLVQTPREAKRVFNLYRTLRASGNLSPASVFLGDDQTPGDFQAVIVLLGLLTAEPRLVGDLLWAPPDAENGQPGGICHRSSNTTWSALLVELEKQPGEWKKVLPKLRQASALVTLPDLTAFQRWGPLVARFSFILSPLAAGAMTGVTTAPPGPTREMTMAPANAPTR